MKPMTNKFGYALTRLLCLAHLLLATTLCAAAPAAAQPPVAGAEVAAPPPLQQERRHVLLLTAYQFGLPVPDSIHRGILVALKESNASVGDIFVEHLDLNRHSGSEYRTHLAAALRHKLKDKRIGIVIAEGAPTLDFLVNEAKGLFPDAALLTLITPNISALAGDPRKVIDIPWRVDPAGTLSAALKLFPDTRRVVVVTGARDGILPFLEEAKLALAPWQGKLDIEFTHQMSYEQMLQRVSTLAANSLVIYSPYFSDSTGRSFIPAEVAVTVGQTATAPVFGTMEAYLGRGIGGGSLLKTEAVGKQAGKIALDYLSGRLELVKPVTTIITPTQMMFDQNELTRWKADSTRLPEGSIVINRAPTLWGQYKLGVIASLVVLMALSALTATLFMFNRRLKKTNIEARDSQEQFRIMVDSAPEAIVVLAMDPLRIVAANSRAEKLFGCSQEQLRQQGLPHFYLPVQPDGLSASESFATNNAKALQGEEVVFERAIRSADGRDLTCEVRLVRLPHHGKWLLRGSFIDITERKRIELDLQQSEATFRKLFESSSDAILLIDDSGVFVECNQAALLLLKMTRAQFLLLPPSRISPEFQPDGRRSAEAALEMIALAYSKGLHRFDWTCVNAEGGEFIVEVSLMPVAIKGQTMLHTTWRDITERKRTEAALREINEGLEQRVEQRTHDLALAKEAAEASERFTYTVTDAIPGQIAYVTKDMRYGFANKAYREMFGKSAEEMRGIHLRDLLGEDLYQKSLPFFQATLGGETLSFLRTISDREGNPVYLWANYVPYILNGEVRGIFGLFSDVTELKNAQLQLEHLNQQLELRTRQAEAANIAKSTFLANMSHELRTPLNAVLGFSQLLQRDSDLGEDSRKKLATINRAGQHLLALINDVLEISRIEAGRITTQRQAFDLKDLLISIEEMIQVRADAKGLAFHVEHANNLPAFVEGDGPHLKQVLINLLGNAVKYTEQGSVSLQVSRRNGDIDFEVADTGPGIAVEDQERIFQAFYQTEVGIAKGDGTGLGLAISQEYTQLMNGQLSVESLPGKGSLFTLSLPLAETAASIVKGASSHVIGLETGQDDIRVLVVDDKPDNRELAQLLLEAAGFKVLTADNGLQAIGVFKNWQPRFIWMDMRMPVMDGYESTRQIRALPGGDTVKIVALTASAFEEDRRAILAAGCDDMVRKPLEEARLFAVMGELLGVRYRHADAVEAPAQQTGELDLSMLSTEVLKKLKAAAEALQLDAIHEILTQLRATHPAHATALEMLTKEFRFDRMVERCKAAEDVQREKS